MEVEKRNKKNKQGRKEVNRKRDVENESGKGQGRTER